MIKLNKYKVRFGEWDHDYTPPPRERTPEQEVVAKPIKAKKKQTKVVFYGYLTFRYFYSKVVYAVNQLFLTMTI